jgi:hypothetical protein
MIRDGPTLLLCSVVFVHDGARICGDLPQNGVRSVVDLGELGCAPFESKRARRKAQEGLLAFLVFLSVRHSQVLALVAVVSLALDTADRFRVVSGSLGYSLTVLLWGQWCFFIGCHLLCRQCVVDREVGWSAEDDLEWGQVRAVDRCCSVSEQNVVEELVPIRVLAFTRE